MQLTFITIQYHDQHHFFRFISILTNFTFYIVALPLGSDVFI